jgi:hypothetical protein
VETKTSNFLKAVIPITKQAGITVMFQTCIQEVLGLNPGGDTGHPDRFLVVFLSSSRKMLR